MNRNETSILRDETAVKLHHRNICAVHDAGQVGDLDFPTMTFIEGKPLSAYISPKKPLDQRQIALIIRRLALGLQVAHDAGVIHRYLKPSNVVIDGQGEPVVMDFGLAGHVDSSADSRLTATGRVLGTRSYMSPEQVRGTNEKIGPKSDIYSPGVMLFELLSGRIPFRGNAAMVQLVGQDSLGNCRWMDWVGEGSGFESEQRWRSECVSIDRRWSDRDLG